MTKSADINQQRTVFLSGTVLKPGAKGAAVRLLQKKLKELNRRGVISAGIRYTEYMTSRFGKSTVGAVREYAGFLRPELNRFDGVDCGIWQSLGLPVGKTWQDMFAIPKARSHGATISVEIKENTATICWQPLFIIYKYGPDGLRRKLSPESADFTEAVRSALDGALRWSSEIPPHPNSPCIHGVSGNVCVEIYDAAGRKYNPHSDIHGYSFSAPGRFNANVVIRIGKPYKAIVWDSFFWRRNKRLRVNICMEKCGHIGNYELSRTIEHEFGHVLGLFDAYGYASKSDPADGSLHYGGHPWPDGLLPPAPIDGVRIKRNSVMVCNYSACDDEEKHICRFACTSLDYEMILLAWRDNRLQLFADSILGKKSQAFYW